MKLGLVALGGCCCCLFVFFNLAVDLFDGPGTQVEPLNIELEPFFVQNKGQVGSSDVLYYAAGADSRVNFMKGQVFLEQIAAGARGSELAEVERDTIIVSVGDETAVPVAGDLLPSYSSYFFGSDRSGWHSKAGHARKIRYEDVYPGVDLEFSFTESGQLDSQYIFSPGALKYGGTGPVLSGSLRGEASAQASLIPMTLKFAGLASIGQWRTCVVDDAGSLYLAGDVGPDFPATAGAFDEEHGAGADVGVMKLDAAGKVVWATFMGGPKEDYAYVSAVSKKRELYVSGRASVGFPTTEGAFDETFNGGVSNAPIHDEVDAFVTRISADGSSLIYSTYLGGSGQDIGRAIHLHPSGEVVITDNTSSKDFPTTPGALLETAPVGAYNGYVTKLNADGSDLIFSTYLGTENARNEFVFGVAEDLRGNYWFEGSTTGRDWGRLAITPDALQPTHGGGKNECFVGKISGDGKRLVYLSWLGGSDREWIETEGMNDSEGNFYIAGQTLSPDFPTTKGAYQTEKRGFSDGFVVKIGVDGSLQRSTRFGGDSPGDENFWGPALDPQGNVYCAGLMRSQGLATAGAFQTREAGKGDGFLAVFDPNLSQLLYGSYLGGSELEAARFVAVAPDGSAAYLVGHSGSSDFPVIKSPWSPELSVEMTFVGKFRNSIGK